MIKKRNGFDQIFQISGSIFGRTVSSPPLNSKLKGNNDLIRILLGRLTDYEHCNVFCFGFYVDTSWMVGPGPELDSKIFSHLRFFLPKTGIFIRTSGY